MGVSVVLTMAIFENWELKPPQRRVYKERITMQALVGDTASSQRSFKPGNGAELRFET